MHKTICSTLEKYVLQKMVLHFRQAIANHIFNNLSLIAIPFYTEPMASVHVFILVFYVCK